MKKGIFSWFDYVASDVDKGIDFYGEAVGWKAVPWGDEGYQMFMIGDDQPVGGIVELPEQAAAMGAPPHWMSYISCDDADALATRAEELGGKVLKAPFDIPTVGRTVIVQDPQGAAFGAVAFEEEMTPASPATAGAFSWTELMTSNWEAAWDFYRDLFGWQKGEAMDMGEMGTYQLFETAGEIGGGMMNLSDEMGDMPYWLYYVTTDDLDAAVTRIEQNGGKLLNGPMEVPGGGRVAQFMDNQNGGFALYEGASE